MKFEINLCKTLHPHFPYVISKVKIEEKKKQQHLKTYLNKCLHLCIWTAKFELWEVFCCCWFVYLFNFKMAKKRRIPFVLFAFAQYENNYEPPPPPRNGYWFQTKRRPSKWFKYWIKCKNNLLKDYANWTQERHERLCIHKWLCAYLPVKFLSPNKKLSRLTLRVFNFIRGGVQL